MTIDLDQLHTEALAINDGDRNAQRAYSAARTVDLRRWLGNVHIVHGRAVIDPWTLDRRVRLMRAELATRDMHRT